MGSHSVSPQPDPAAHHTLPRLAELGASSSTRPSSSASLNVLLNPVSGDDVDKRTAGPQQPPPTASAWTAVNHPPRDTIVLEPRVAAEHSQAPSQRQPQHHDYQPSPNSFTNPGPSSSFNQQQGQVQRPAEDCRSFQPIYDNSSPSAYPGPHSPAITVVWSSPTRRRSRSSKQGRQVHRSSLSIHPRTHPATPPSPAPSPELEPIETPSTSQSMPQPSSAPGPPMSDTVAPLSNPESQQSSNFARPAHPAHPARVGNQTDTMPMPPPPNPVAGVFQRGSTVAQRASQATAVSPSSPDVCTRCYDVWMQKFRAAMQWHEQQSQGISLSKNSFEEYNRFLEAGRGSIAAVRPDFDSVCEMCPECAGKPREDSIENVKVAFRDIMPIREHPATSTQNGKRKLVSENGLVEDESSPKSRKVSPELASPTLCESTPPPEPGTTKMLLQDINNLFLGFYSPRPPDDVVPTGPLERTARSLGLATDKPSNVSARNDPAPGDWTNMYYDPVYDSGKISVSGRMASGAKESTRVNST